MLKKFLKNMQEGIDVKADYAWPRRVLRVDDNLLLDHGAVILLLTNDYEFLNTPFLDIKNDNYKTFYKNQLDQFEKDLKINGYQVKKLNSFDDLKNLVQDKDIILDYIPGEYELSIDSSLNKFANISYVKHCNYFLQDDQFVISKLKEKIGFSAFRKKFEKLAIKESYQLKERTFKNQADQVWLDFLESKAPLTYFETRNKMIGNNYSTRLSHLLNLGQISPLRVVEDLCSFEEKYGSNKSTYWIKFELLWREYFYWLYQYHGEDFFRSNGLNGGEFNLTPISIDSYLKQMNKHPLIQSMNKELMQTGFLSNRSRQIYASYLMHETKLDWRYGAWFFQYFLNDYDLYSNWGNWLYCSGNGTDPRGPRYFHIPKQLKQYDPSGEYLDYWTNK